MAKLNTVLLEFARCTRVLADLLRENPPLTAVDQLLIENHLHVVQLAYSVWKRQHGLSDQEGPPAKDIPVTTVPPPNHNVVWVTVEKVQQPRTRWTFTLSEYEPGSVRSVTFQNRRIPMVRPCRSYTELCAWLRTYGFTPPASDYFMPTAQELAEDAESILRKVTRPR